MSQPDTDATVVSEVAAGPPWDPSIDRRAAALVFVLVWVVYLLTATYWAGQMNDTRATSQSAWSLGTQGTLALPEQWRGEVDWEVEGRDGRVYTNRFPGPILWEAPFHTVVEMVDPRGVPGHPFLISYVPSGLAAATGSALAVLVSYLGFRRLVERRTAIGAALVLAFATGVWSVAAESVWPHTTAHLGLAIGMFMAARGQHAASGLGFALAIISRPHLAIVAATVGIWGGLAERKARIVIAMGATSALGLVGMVTYSYVLFGTRLPVAGYGDYAVSGLVRTGVHEFGVNLFYTFTHPSRGVLIYTPMLLVLLPFVRHGWRVAPWWVRSSAMGGLLYLFVQMRANSWMGGAQYFGSRLTIEPLVLVAPLLVLTWQAKVAHVAALRGLLKGFIVVAVALHALGATVWRAPFTDLEEIWIDRMEVVCGGDEPAVGCDRPVEPRSY